jgi:opacity protein-like surface antigen
MKSLPSLSVKQTMSLGISASFASMVALLVTAAMPADALARDAKRGHRPIPSWYMSLGGSVNFVSDTTVSQRGGATNNRGTVTLDEGYGVAGAIGYRPRYTNTFWDNTRFEVEAGYLTSDIGRVTSSVGALPAITGDIKSRRLMFNSFVDLDMTPEIRPYVGAGVGLASVTLRNETDSTFAYQLMAGVNYIPQSFPLLELGLGYRYLTIDDIAISQPAAPSLKFDYEAHAVEASIRAYF